MNSLRAQVAKIEVQAAELQRRLPRHVEGEVLARLKTGTEVESFMATRAEDGLELLETFELGGSDRTSAGTVVRLKLPEGISTAQGMTLLEQDPRLAYVTSNDIRRVEQTPNDLGDQLWGMHKIQAEKAWDLTTGSANGPIIAVLDTGVDTNHPDLKNNLIAGYNAVDQNSNMLDDYGHGTHCIGTIAAQGNNGQGVVGVNWQARVMPIRMMSHGEGTVADGVRAVLYATQHGAAITSNSYGGPYSQPEYEAFASSPLLHICAAGNESRDNDVAQYYPDGGAPASYPATYDFPNIISVAATDRNDRLASFSNYGAKTVDLAAPGTSILSTVPGGGYETKAGTSMATPHVAGVAGLIATLYPDSTPEQIKTRLLANVDVVPGLATKMTTGGRLNALRALEDDRLAPDAPAAKAESSDWKSVSLSWVHSADDGSLASSGSATSTEIRWMDADGRAQRQILGAGAPGTAGKARVSLYPSSQARQVTLEVLQSDNVGNLSQPSQVQVTVPAAKVAHLEWESDGKWGQVTLPRGTVWTDSPQGNYANHEDSSLVSKPFVVEGVEPQLTFDVRHRLEPMSDFARVEIKTEGGEWKKLADYTSYSEWKSEKVDLSAYQNQRVQLRFRLTSDSVKNDEGVYLDRICVAGG